MFENVDGRRTDAGVIGILIAHIGAFGSGGTHPSHCSCEITKYRLLIDLENLVANLGKRKRYHCHSLTKINRENEGRNALIGNLTCKKKQGISMKKVLIISTNFQRFIMPD